MKKIYLKPNRDKALRNFHPWVFSGAIRAIEDSIADGELVAVCDHRAQKIGTGYLNRNTDIAVRMLGFGDGDFNDDALRALIANACARRERIIHANTTACRLIFSEGDFLPGLIVDRYDRHLSVQFLTLGMERLKNTILQMLIDILAPESIYERSESEGRALEGAIGHNGPLFGNTPDEIIIRENDLRFCVSIPRGQKTGFYLDQRDNRALIKNIAAGREVLNLFSYTGGFGIAAMAGGARRVISVDSSADALAAAEKNAGLNEAAADCVYQRADVFSYIRNESITGDCIIIDPPALAKNRQAVDHACRGYKDLNLQVIKKCPAGALILTCSCSRFIDMRLFQMLVFEACADAGRRARIIGKYGQPADHPISVFCPETEYLKALLLHID